MSLGHVGLLGTEKTTDLQAKAQQRASCGLSARYVRSALHDLDAEGEGLSGRSGFISGVVFLAQRQPGAISSLSGVSRPSHTSSGVNLAILVAARGLSEAR